jgi:hypothetical protein
MTQDLFVVGHFVTFAYSTCRNVRLKESCSLVISYSNETIATKRKRSGPIIRLLDAHTQQEVAKFNSEVSQVISKSIDLDLVREGV